MYSLYYKLAYSITNSVQAVPSEFTLTIFALLVPRKPSPPTGVENKLDSSSVRVVYCTDTII
jgi:hypothetical protein